MAFKITPDGGFYVDDTSFNVDYNKKQVSLKGGTSGNDITADGGMFNPGAVLSGDETLNIDLNNHKISNIATPTDNNDAVNKLYVDNKKGVAVANPAGTEGEQLQTTLNALLTSLRNAGLIAQS